MNGDLKGVLQPREALTQPIPGRVAKIHGHQVSPGPLASTSSTFQWEVNTDPDILARVWDGTTTVFAVDSSGNVTAYTVIIYPATSSAVPLVIHDGAGGTSNNWTEWRTTAGTLVTWVGNAGIVRTTAEYQAMVANTDTQPATRLGTSGLLFGAGGAAATDTNLYRVAVNGLKTDGDLTAGGSLTASAMLEVDGFEDLVTRGSAPAAPAAGRLRIYVTNDGSAHPQIRVKNSAGTTQTLTTFVDGA